MLNLANNAITGSIPTYLSQLVNLAYLSFANNLGMSGSVPASLTVLTALTYAAVACAFNLAATCSVAGCRIRNRGGCWYRLAGIWTCLGIRCRLEPYQQVSRRSLGFSTSPYRLYARCNVVDECFILEAVETGTVALAWIPDTLTSPARTLPALYQRRSQR